MHHATPRPRGGLCRRASALPLLMALLALAAFAAWGAPRKARAEGVVNVYSERQPVFLEEVFARFTEETGIRVETLFAKRGLVERLKLEGEASPADVVMVADVGRLQQLKDEGVTRAVDDGTLRQNIPAASRDPGNHWFGVTRRARILFARRGAGWKGRDPARPTYEELGAPGFGGTVCVRSGRHPYNIALIAAHVAHHGEAATEEWLRNLKGRLGRAPQGNDRAQITAARNGECDYALANSYYYLKMLDDPGQREIAEDMEPLLAEFESGGTHVNLSGYAMARHSPNPGNALALMRFLTGRAAQEIYAEANGEFPVRDGVPLAPRMAGTMGGLRADPTPVGVIAANRAAASRLVEKVGFDR